MGKLRARQSATDVVHFDLALLAARLAQRRTQLAVAVGALRSRCRGCMFEQLIVAGAGAQRRRAGSCPAWRTGRYRVTPSEDRRAREQSPQNGCVTEEMKPTSPAPSAKRVALGDFAAIVALERRRAASARRCARPAPARARPAPARQWLRLPTSMYSMKRTITPVPRKCSTRSRTV